MDSRPAMDWTPPDHWLAVDVVDSHAGGEPFRVLLGGMPDLEGDTVLARRGYALENYDGLRTALMWEPRGHADMYGGWIDDPVDPDSDLSVLFVHNEGFSTMCGHGVIALTKVAIDTGIVGSDEPKRVLRIDTPAGLVVSTATVRDGTVLSVEFQNVVSFVDSLDNVVEVPDKGEVRYDIAYGGAYYAYVDASEVGIEWPPESQVDLITAAAQIKKAIGDSYRIEHPLDADLGFLYGVIFTGPPSDSENRYRNVCVFADGEVDRSPTGTGVSGRLAIDHARGILEIGETITVESIIGTTFTGRIDRESRVGVREGIVPVIGGTAHITGRSTLWIDPDDPLAHGFLIR